MKNIIKTIAVASLLTLSSPVSADDAKETSITIYSSAGGYMNPESYLPSKNYFNPRSVPGYGIVKQVIEADLERGRSKLSIIDVAQFIEPTTVLVKSKTAPKDTKILEQDFRFDLVSLEKLAEKYLGSKVKLKDGGKEGTLLSMYGETALFQDGRTKEILTLEAKDIIYPSLPDNFYTKPTLVWDIFTDIKGEQEFEFAYETKGLTWWADYNAIFREGADENSGYLDFASWVTIVNKSGTGYEESNLRLVAGDVNKVQPSRAPRRYAKNVMMAEASFDSAPPGFEGEKLFEYHSYKLGRKVDLANNSTKQIELMPAITDIPVKKEFIYHGSSAYRYYGSTVMDQYYGSNVNADVNINIIIQNDKESGLGVPLPKGRIRVNQATNDGSIEFIGEDKINHTPKDERVVLKLGKAFDIKGERKQVNFKHDKYYKEINEDYSITLKNHKDKDVTVSVLENMYRSSNWLITSRTHDYEKINANLIKFPVTVPADGETIIEYSVRYRY